MRRLRLLSLGILLGVAMPAAAQTVTFGLARDGSAFQFEEVRMPVWADMSAAGGELLGSYTVRITYNPAVLVYQGIEPGTFATPVVRTDSTFLGVLWLTAASASGAGGVVDLARIVFYVQSDSTSTVGIQVTEASAAGTFTDLLPVVATSGGVYCPARGRWGDVTGDGNANSADALIVLSYVVGLTVDTLLYDLPVGDADGDGRTDTRDALILLSYAVGLDISGRRVLTVAPGACAVQGASQVAVTPDTLDVVIGQRAYLRVTTRDAAGVTTFINGLNWIVDDALVGAVDPDAGEFVALAAGSTVLRAYLGPGIAVTVPVTVRPRRSVWYVNGAVTAGALALGNARYPFRTPQQVFPLATEGDTIRIAPGIVDYDPTLTSTSTAGVVFVGDTLADGTRPLLRAPNRCCVAFGATVAGHVEFRDLELAKFNYAVNVSGARAIVMRNVTLRVDSAQFAGAITVGARVDTVDVENTQFLAPAAALASDAVFLGDGARFVRAVNVTIVNFSDGFYVGNGADSVHVTGSVFTNLADALGLYGGPLPFGGVYVAGNRVTGSGRGVAGFDVLRATLTNNIWERQRFETVQLYAPVGQPAGSVRYRLLGDSVRSPAYGYDWIEADRFDTLLVQDVHVAMDTTFVYMFVQGDHATFRRTVLDGVHWEGFDLDVHTAVLDTVSALGCATCAFGSVSGVNVRSRTGEPGLAVTVRGGTFRRLLYGLFLSTVGNLPEPLVVRDAVYDSVSRGVWAYVDSAVIQNVAMTGVQGYGILLYPSGDRPASSQYHVLQNRIGCLPSGINYGVYLERTATVFQGNYVQDCSYGIYTYTTLLDILDVSFTGDSIFLTGHAAPNRGIFVQNRWRPVLQGVRVRGGIYGVDITTNDTATVRVDSSAMSLSTTAGLRLALGTGAAATGVRNNIVDNVLDGILNSGTGTRSFTLGRFQNNGRWGVSSTPIFDATNNWWGAATGPSSIGIADTVSGAVTISPFLTVDPTDVPAPAPPAVSRRAPPVAAPAMRAAAPVVLPPETVHGDAERARVREEKLRRARRPAG